MRVLYIGQDGRARVTRIARIKFLEDGLQSTDKRSEQDMAAYGPLIVIHTIRNRGGKRIMVKVPPSFNMVDAQQCMLEKGYLDLSGCDIVAENLYS